MKKPSSVRSEIEPLRELLRAVRTCHPDWETPSRITFTAPSGLVLPWRDWNAMVFQPILWPLLEGAYQAARSGDGLRLIACDEDGDHALPEAMAAVSRSAGARLLRGHRVPAGERVWRRYADRTKIGAAPGHFATVLAVRAAAFHLSPALLPAVYLFLEARGARLDDDEGDVMRMVDACLIREVAWAPKLLLA